MTAAKPPERVTLWLESTEYIRADVVEKRERALAEEIDLLRALEGEIRENLDCIRMGFGHIALNKLSALRASADEGEAKR